MNRLFLFVALVGLAGCVPDGLTDFDFQGLQPDPPADELTGEVVVGTARDAGLTVELTAMRGGPHLGYVRLGLLGLALGPRGLAFGHRQPAGQRPVLAA